MRPKILKRFLFFLLVLTGALSNAAKKRDYSRWERLQSDLGRGPSAWVMCSGPRNHLVKEFELELEISEIKSAVLEYEIFTDPHDKKLKAYISDVRHNWAKLLLQVNGTVAAELAAGPLIVKGTHHIDIPVSLLQKGNNRIALGWKEPETGETMGYIYFAIDLTEAEKERRKLPAKQRGKLDNDVIRLRLLLQLEQP